MVSVTDFFGGNCTTSPFAGRVAAGGDRALEFPTGEGAGDGAEAGVFEASAFGALPLANVAGDDDDDDDSSCLACN